MSSLTKFQIVIGVCGIIGCTLAFVGVLFAVAHCFGWKYYMGKSPPQVVELTAGDREALRATQRSTATAVIELKLLNGKTNYFHPPTLPRQGAFATV